MSAATPIDTAAVLKLPAKAKRELLDALLADFGAQGVLQLDRPEGPEYIYRAPPNAKELAEEAARNATPEELAELDRRANAPDSEYMSFEEVLRIGEEDDPPSR